jgi:hypothetical protein
MNPTDTTPTKGSAGSIVPCERGFLKYTRGPDDAPLKIMNPTDSSPKILGRTHYCPF